MFGRKGRRPTAIQTLVGENTQIAGDLHFSGGCHIDGQVNGSVLVSNDPDGFLSVSEYGCVKGNVNVPRVALSGTIEGDLLVTEKAELGPTARVTGNVYYNLIEIAAGAEINGKLIHEVEAAKPAAKAAKPKAAAKAVEVDVDLGLDAVAEQNS
ncbi:MAG: polymer-forming cytoskeletal protein [Gammaproteobacteria bacterium]|nr:polymer-forming cytoskeletal protein [Gammaproteobacteria bacterium]NND53706.1 polymer-forming cytoskeletal protein [Gammaproteobacteria bacterium]